MSRAALDLRLEAHRLSITKRYRVRNADQLVKLVDEVGFCFAFTLRTYAEACGMQDVKITQFFGDNAFKQLKEAKKVRDRLTHPKKRVDIIVTEDDLLNVTYGYHWASQFISDIEAMLE